MLRTLPTGLHSVWIISPPYFGRFETTALRIKLADVSRWKNDMTVAQSAVTGSWYKPAIDGHHGLKAMEFMNSLYFSKKFRPHFRVSCYERGVETLKEAYMPFISSLLVAASVIALLASAQAQTVAAPVPATMSLSPNNCGTPDTPKPCHFTRRMRPSKAVHHTNATTPPK
jgi:hypothetical protein